MRWLFLFQYHTCSNLNPVCLFHAHLLKKREVKHHREQGHSCTTVRTFTYRNTYFKPYQIILDARVFPAGIMRQKTKSKHQTFVTLLVFKGIVAICALVSQITLLLHWHLCLCACCVCGMRSLLEHKS